MDYRKTDIQQLYELLPKCSPSTIRTNNRGMHDLLLANSDNYLIVIAHENYTPESFVINKSDQHKNNSFKIYLDPLPCKLVSGNVYNSDQRVLKSRLIIRNDCTSKPDTLITDEFGRYEFCLNLGCSFEIQASSEGYEEYTKRLNLTNYNDKDDLSMDIELIALEEVLAAKVPPRRIEVKAGSNVILDRIYYDFNKSDIKEGAAKELDVIAKAMTLYSEMEIELIAHTDSRGGRNYNLELSLERALSAKQYLVNKGIDPNRIFAFGYGEGSLRNDCKDGVDCTDEEHAFNRRTEIKVLTLDNPIELIFTDE